MIDEYWTWQFYGYYSYDLKPQSNKPIVARCDGCCKYRISSPYAYRDLCQKCVMRTPERKRDMSIERTGRSHKPHSKTTLLKMSQSQLGKTIPQEQRDKISKSLMGRQPTYEQRCKQSAAMQGVSLDDWEGFAHEQKYCPAFNESIKERVREKYGRLCFVCGKTEVENLDTHKEKLSVHHTDMNKQQGCDEHEWKLVPLCKVCHSSAHYEPTKARIEYVRHREEMTAILQ